MSNKAFDLFFIAAFVTGAVLMFYFSSHSPDGEIIEMPIRTMLSFFGGIVSSVAFAGIVGLSTGFSS